MSTPTSEALEAAKMNPERSLRTGQGSALRGILVNSALGGAKLAAGILGHSYALIADAAESFGDVMGSCVTFIGLRLAAEPADQTHPAGHGRAETLASIITALALCVVGGLIFWEAAATLSVPRQAPNPLTLLVLVPVILIKEWMFHWMRARGKKIGSLAVIADAWHQRSDVVTSVAALVGIIVAWIGGSAWSHADSWAAMLASVWLTGTGLWLLGPGLHEIMEGSVDPALLQFILESSRSCPGIRDIDKVWVRKLGMRLMIDMHIEVDPDISVLEGHRLAHEVKAKLQAELPQVRDVMVHIEPYDPERAKRPYRIQSGG
ncbi:MAG: cation diffusion facilitator family transporter [Methylacidiphilales bacterium]|nr:cation diffusion facilitator family transporter [Candidatus Methylacidiphilales bacterium]